MSRTWDPGNHQQDVAESETREIPHCTDAFLLWPYDANVAITPAPERAPCTCVHCALSCVVLEGALGAFRSHPA